jgi:hypothetical protein
MTKFAPCFRLLTVLALLLAQVQCTNAPVVTVIQVLPNAATTTAIGQTVQFKALGTFAHAGGRPAPSRDITNQVAWVSSNAGVSTINTSGLATTTGTGFTTITATLDGVAGAATLFDSSNAAARHLTALTVIQDSRTIANLGEPAQFIAIGTFNTNPMTQDVTDQATWESSDARVASVNSNGLALGNDCGTTTITAKSNKGSAITSSAILTYQQVSGACPSSAGAVQPTLTVYEVGQGSGSVVSNSAVINCASGEGCSASFVSGTSVTLIATPASGSSFGGWSSNCTPDSANTCTIVLSNSEPVGAIFNSQ